MKRDVEKVAMPAKIKGEYFVRALNPLEDLDRVDLLDKAGEDPKRRVAIQLSYFASNADGEQLFPTPELALEHMGQPGTRSAVVTRLVLAGMKFNSTDDEALESAEKN